MVLEIDTSSATLVIGKRQQKLAEACQYNNILVTATRSIIGEAWATCVKPRVGVLIQSRLEEIAAAVEGLRIPTAGEALAAALSLKRNQGGKGAYVDAHPDPSRGISDETELAEVLAHVVSTHSISLKSGLVERWIGEFSDEGVEVLGDLRKCVDWQDIASAPRSARAARDEVMSGVELLLGGGVTVPGHAIDFVTRVHDVVEDADVLDWAAWPRQALNNTGRWALPLWIHFASLFAGGQAVFRVGCTDLEKKDPSTWCEKAFFHVITNIVPELRGCDVCALEKTLLGVVGVMEACVCVFEWVV